MKIIKMKLSELHQPERNVRIHSEKQLREMERSISMFGQIRPLVIDETNTILAGNGLYLTLIRMGADEADVFQIENLTSNQKKKLMIADNKIFGLGIDDLDTFNAFLEELQNDLDIPGFDEEILQSMVSEAEEITERISEYGTLDDEDIQTIQANGKRLDEKIHHVEAQQQAAVGKAYRPSVNSTDEDTTQICKFLVCPKCGEKVWL